MAIQPGTRVYSAVDELADNNQIILAGTVGTVIQDEDGGPESGCVVAFEGTTATVAHKNLRVV